MLFSFSAGEKHTLRAFAFDEALPIGMDGNIEMFPVVHAGTAQVRFIDDETERFNEMQASIGADAEASDCTGILGDRWSDEDNIHRSLVRKVNSLILP